MKNTILVVLCVIMSGCAHVRQVSWQGDTIKLCGNKFAEQTDFDELAAKSCPKNYRAIAGGIEDSGNAMIMSTGFGNHTVVAQKQQCMVYECK